MNDTIIIEIEVINSCFGLSARFWKGKEFSQTDLKHVTNEMHRLTDYYKETTGKDVVFKVKKEG